MKKVTLTDLNGKEIEVYFADDKTAESAVHGDQYEVKIEDVPSDKDWFDMTGGGLGSVKEAIGGFDSKGPDSKVSQWSEDESSLSFYQSLNKNFLNKVKGLGESPSQISIDDTIPSDFVDNSDLRGGSIYKVARLGLIAKLVERMAYTPQLDATLEQKWLLKMKRHGTIFYVEEGSLMKATDLEVQTYLEESK